MERPQFILAACALVTRDNGDILLVKTGYRAGWEVPGGVVEHGENPLQGAIRETYEETGITVNITAMTGIYTNLERNLNIFAFLGHYISGDLTPSEETPDVAWVARDKVLGLVEEPTMFHRMRDMLAYNGKITYRSYTKNPYQDVSVVQLAMPELDKEQQT